MTRAVSPPHAGTVHVEHVMGTVFSLDLRDPVPLAAVEAIVAMLHRLDELCSTYLPGSEVSRLRRGELALADADPDVRRAAELCEQARELTGGWFDAAADGLFDPSGVVKGWAVERAAALLVAAGSRRHSVNGGGDVAVGLGPEPGRPWRIGVADPLHPGGLLAAVRLETGGVATSGTAERGGHVFDPRTGLAARGLAGVTVVGPSLLRADVLATAAVAAGPAAAPELLRSQHGYEWLLVTADGRQVVSPGWTALT